MTNDNDLLLLASSQNNGTYKVYIDRSGKKTLTPQTSNHEASYVEPYICNHKLSVGLLYDKNPKKVICPNCSKARAAFYNAFYGCTSLTSVSFPSLTSATGANFGFPNGAFESAFYGCTSLTSVSFPSLTSATGGVTSTDISAFYNAFYGCTSLTSVSFPSLTTVELTGAINKDYNGGFYKAFVNCSPSLKVHFKKSMEGEPKLDYSTLHLTSADQVVFDLP